MVERVQLMGESHGYKLGAVFEILGAGKWEQTSADFDFNYDFMPEADFEDFGSTGRLKIEGHDDWIDIRRLPATGGAR